MNRLRKIMNYGKAEVLNAEKEKISKEPDLRNLFWETTLRCNAKMQALWKQSRRM